MSTITNFTETHFIKPIVAWTFKLFSPAGWYQFSTSWLTDCMQTFWGSKTSGHCLRSWEVDDL